ncbi:class I SAM-dependent methyltransferase [Nocardia sp. NPDC058176]|uniref:class I SAM-dependent methyltransferase n=1 Tax=Nocardia sp. NPDC058176 TaxID=3346368 RepID=UPI0036D972B9
MPTTQQISTAWQSDSYQKVNAPQTAANLRALELVDDLVTTGARLVDVGCGTGEVAKTMAERGLRVTAIDGSQSMVDATAEACADLGVTAACLDANELDLEAAGFEIVHCSWVLHWLRDLDSAIAALAGAVAPGGALVLQWSRALAPAEGRGQVGVFEDLAAGSEWAPKLRDLGPSINYQYPVDDVVARVGAAGLVVDHIDTALWGPIPTSVEPTPEIVESVVQRLRHTGFGVHEQLLGTEELLRFLRAGVVAALDAGLTDPRDVRLIARRPSLTPAEPLS